MFIQTKCTSTIYSYGLKKAVTVKKTLAFTNNGVNQNIMEPMLDVMNVIKPIGMILMRFDIKIFGFPL